ncbi:hypothetical protein B0H14DRAFT_2557497 [Mycena olivaceomarginata]|nr:hypothetical protein B0H14DRAFT_2557497 [Mycena olivaceomarginata]
MPTISMASYGKLESYALGMVYKLSGHTISSSRVGMPPHPSLSPPVLGGVPELKRGKSEAYLVVVGDLLDAARSDEMGQYKTEIRREEIGTSGEQGERMGNE